jgi:hypothetical protein
MMKNHGVWTSSSKRFKHSTVGIVPVVDTVSISEDSFMASYPPTTNYGTDTYLQIGKMEGDVGGSLGLITYKAWIKPDFTGISAGVIFGDSYLWLTPTTDNSSSATTMEAHRCRQDVIEAEMTWNKYRSGDVRTNWTTAGAGSTSGDYDSEVMGSMSVPASPTLNTPMGMLLKGAVLQKIFNGTYSNFGILLFLTTSTDPTLITYASTEHATSSYRPYISLVHT